MTDVIALRIQSKKGFSQFQTWNEQLCVLFMPDLQELHRSNEPRAEQIRATGLGYTAQTVYLWLSGRALR